MALLLFAYMVRFVRRVFSKRTEIEFELLNVEDATIAIGGIAPDPRLDRRADPLEGVEYKTPRADVAILLFHCGFEGNTPPGFAEAILPKSRVAAMKGIDYFFLGDIHSTHKSIVGDSTIIVPGATERLNFGELKSKPGFYYAELDGKTAVKLTHQTIEPQPMRRETIRTTNIPADLPTEYIFERLHEWSAKDQLMQLRIEGPIQREVYHHLCFLTSGDSAMNSISTSTSTARASHSNTKTEALPVAARSSASAARSSAWRLSLHQSEMAMSAR
jgi:DNA repair exonuclease SbcCD nuclease subunit